MKILVAAVGLRAERVVARLRSDGSRVLIFGHSHFTQILATRWSGLTSEDAMHLLLSTALPSRFDCEHNLDDPAILFWIDDDHVSRGG